MYKVIETVESQIYRFVVGSNPGGVPIPDTQKIAGVNFECPKCKEHYIIQLNLGQSEPLKPGHVPYPIDDNIFKCPNCSAQSNLANLRIQVEAQTGKKLFK